MNPETVDPCADIPLRPAVRLAALFFFARVLFQFLLTLYTQHLGYGYLRDEFYYIACGRHLAWGYVDHGPVVALQARLAELLFGQSIFATRIFSAVAESSALFLTGILTWALGGRRPSQALAMTGLFVAPITIAMGGTLNMNSFDTSFWTICILALVLLSRGLSPALCWPAFGISAGLGLLNKPSTAFFLATLFIALLLTPQRRILRTRWFALGAAILLLLALPNVLWQVHHHWPTLEYLHSYFRYALSPLGFFLSQVRLMLPVSVLLWLPGVFALLRERTIPQARWLGLTYLICFVLFKQLHAKDYYLAPIYPALFAAGAIAWERRFARSSSVQRGSAFAFPVYQTVLAVTGAILLPLSSPILRPASWLTYTHTLHLISRASYMKTSNDFPQFFSDRFLWNEEATAVVDTWRSLPAAGRKSACILADHYGEAGALIVLGQQLEPALPDAISGHNSFWSWGTHGCDPNVTIALVVDTPQQLSSKYQSVEEITYPKNIWASDYALRHHLYLLRGRRPSAPLRWQDERFYY